jgi:hypothetical protein
MSVGIENSEAAILNRVFCPGEGDWPRAAAEAILRAGFGPDDRERMVGLLEKAKAGELNPEEAATLENYRHIGRLLELMKSKARRSLSPTAKV